MRVKMGFMLFIAFLLSCNKDATKPDTIVYHDIIPDHELQTVRFYEFQDHIICTAYVPTPADSSVVCEIDMDGDQVADFRITALHSQYTSGYCGHCDVFTYNIFIEALADESYIARIVDNYYIPRFFEETEAVEKNNEWVPRADLLLLEGCILPFQTDFDKGFLGVRMKDSYGYIKVERLEKNGIRVLEHGFNKTPGQKILCGQKS